MSAKNPLFPRLSECFNNILQQPIDDSKIMYSKFRFVEPLVPAHEYVPKGHGIKILSRSDTNNDKKAKTIRAVASGEESRGEGIYFPR